MKRKDGFVTGWENMRHVPGRRRFATQSGGGMGKLDGKGALITGGATGIGRAISLRFAAEGASVVLAQRNTAAIEATVAEIEAAGGWAKGVPTDITQLDQVEALVDTSIEALGRIDILANNAGRTGSAGPFLEIELDAWREFIETNLTSPFVLAQAVAQHMVAEGVKGRIINTGSVDSFVSEMGATPYAASKGGLWMLTKSMAIELAAHGIAVNLLAPGPILVAKNAPKYEDPAVLAKRTAAIPLGPFGRVEDVAAAALFLASDECQFVTGSAITIDGGTLAKAHF